MYRQSLEYGDGLEDSRTSSLHFVVPNREYTIPSLHVHVYVIQNAMLYTDGYAFSQEDHGITRKVYILHPIDVSFTVHATSDIMCNTGLKTTEKRHDKDGLLLTLSPSSFRVFFLEQLLCALINIKHSVW